MHVLYILMKAEFQLLRRNFSLKQLFTTVGSVVLLKNWSIKP